MYTKQLQDPDGNKVNLFVCGACGRGPYYEAQTADQCCAPVMCRVCGVEVPRNHHRLTCRTCEEAQQRAKERDMFERSEKIDEREYDGWIYTESVQGPGEGFFEDLGALEAYLEEDGELEEVMPAYVWTCHPVAFVQLNPDAVLEMILNSDDAYEDFDDSQIAGWNELRQAIVDFNKKNAHIQSWRPNFKKSILTNAPIEKRMWQYKLHAGDEVTWNDPDGGACSVTGDILSIEFLPEQCARLTMTNGWSSEVRLSELS